MKLCNKISQIKELRLIFDKRKKALNECFEHNTVFKFEDLDASFRVVEVTTWFGVEGQKFGYTLQRIKG